MIGVLVLAILALIMAIVTIIVDNRFSNSKDDKHEEILKLLPNINCGGCGFVNCNNMALEIIKNKEVIYKCRPLKNKEGVLKSVHIILK